MSSAEIQVTVIIPTRNRAVLVLDLLRYLRIELGWTCPLIVVDQSDDHGTALATSLATYGWAAIRHVPQDRRGTGSGRNTGAQLAETAWLVFLDDDVWPVAGYLAALTAFIVANPWLDGVHGSLETPASWQSYRHDPVAWWITRAAASQVREEYPQTLDGVTWFTSSPWTKYQTLTIGLASGNLAIRRAVFLGVGGFDEQIEGVGDDRELGVRLWWYGYRMALAPTLMGFHLREPHGGLRSTRSRWARLLAPEPAVGWIYFYLRWFPGLPYRQMLYAHVQRWGQRPWLLPLKAIRLQRAITHARRRISAGPRYLSAPVPRANLQEGTDDAP